MAGFTLDLDLWHHYLPLAIQDGFVKRYEADYVLNGISHGFDLNVDESRMGEAKTRQNYKSALDNAQMVSDALKKRVVSGKTLKLGPWDPSVGFPTGNVGVNVPQGAVAKKLQPDIMRPVSDHTKTHFNDACDISGLAHSLDTYAEIACF